MSVMEGFETEVLVGTCSPERLNDFVAIVEIHDQEEIEPMSLAKIDKSKADERSYFTGVFIPLSPVFALEIMIVSEAEYR